MKKWEVPASEWPGAGRERFKSRDALKKLDELDRKRAEQLRLQRQLRAKLEEKAYDARTQRNERVDHLNACASCGGLFQRGEYVREFLDDSGRIVNRHHEYHFEAR